MTYIILAAGKGAKLQPLTLCHPKSLYKLNSNITILHRLIKIIRKYDCKAEIIVVIGYMYKQIIMELENENVKFVHNPFYSVTNSLGSLWFGRRFLQRENVTIINGDIVASEDLMRDIVCTHIDYPIILLDSSNKGTEKYNVQVKDKLVCVMSRKLTLYMGNYTGITKLDAISSRFLLEQLEQMVNEEMYDLFFEDALVQMIFDKNFELYYKDIKDYKWVEVDCVDDLLKARELQQESDLNKK